VAQECLSNVRTVRSFAAERMEIGRYSDKVQESYRLGVKKALAYGAFVGGQSPACLRG
jgi:ABC-type multidrug transport system fused ATPase/permease subunit